MTINQTTKKQEENNPDISYSTLREQTSALFLIFLLRFLMFFFFFDSYKLVKLYVKFFSSNQISGFFDDHWSSLLKMICKKKFLKSYTVKIYVTVANKFL